ncbi:MAG: hypothetical protein AB8B63_05160 [Granulosicoccus sp.]
MSSRSKGTGIVDLQKADILNISDARALHARRRNSVKCSTFEPARMLSMRQSLRYKASIRTDERFTSSNWVKEDRALCELNIIVRRLIDTEFGSLRVHTYRQVYIVSHHCIDSLIAGLLRVQFHGKELRLPANSQGMRLTGVPLLWGVGNSVAEAETARQHRPGDRPGSG